MLSSSFLLSSQNEHIFLIISLPWWSCFLIYWENWRISRKLPPARLPAYQHLPSGLLLGAAVSQPCGHIRITVELYKTTVTSVLVPDQLNQNLLVGAWELYFKKSPLGVFLSSQHCEPSLQKKHPCSYLKLIPLLCSLDPISSHLPRT